MRWWYWWERTRTVSRSPLLLTTIDAVFSPWCYDTWTCMHVYTHPLIKKKNKKNTATHKQTHPSSPVSESSHTHSDMQPQLKRTSRWKLDLNSGVKCGVSAQCDWPLGEQLLCTIGWGAAVNTHLWMPTEQSELQGGGPEARVAEHVKQQQVGVERVGDGSTCVLRGNVRTNALECILPMLYVVCGDEIPWCFITNTPTPSSPHASHVCWRIQSHTAAASAWTMCAAMGWTGRKGAHGSVKRWGVKCAS